MKITVRVPATTANLGPGFDTLGLALTLWNETAFELAERRLGLGPTPSGPYALTPREREVARLLAEGLSNSQLAERLFISPRTAAVHVSNILSKLGMSSRTEVAAWAVRDGFAEG